MWNSKEAKEQFIKACAWCRRVYINGKWIVTHIDHEKQNNITHGICHECASSKLKR